MLIFDSNNLPDSRSDCQLHQGRLAIVGGTDPSALHVAGSGRPLETFKSKARLKAHDLAAQEKNLGTLSAQTAILGVSIEGSSMTTKLSRTLFGPLARTAAPMGEQTI